MNKLYWSSTLLISGFLALSAYSYFFSQSTIDGIRKLGLPDYLRIELAVLKLLAIVVIMIPAVPLQIKEWGYAGVGLFLTTAMIAHIVHKDSMTLIVLLLVLISALIISRYTLQHIVK